MKKTKVGPLINNGDLKLPNTLECSQCFAKLHFFIYLYGIDKITTKRTTDKCQLLLKSCFSVRYNYLLIYADYQTAIYSD